MWIVRIVQQDAESFLIQISVNQMKQLMIQFRCSFSLHKDDAANETKSIVINDIDNDITIAIVHERHIVKSIVFARMDESILCLLEGDTRQITELGKYLLEILDTSEYNRLPRADVSFHIHAKPHRFTPTRRNRISRHSDIGNLNVENLTKLNISGPNWNIQPGNSPNERVPSSLSPKTRRQKRKRVHKY